MRPGMKSLAARPRQRSGCFFSRFSHDGQPGFRRSTECIPLPICVANTATARFRDGSRMPTGTDIGRSSTGTSARANKVRTTSSQSGRLPPVADRNRDVISGFTPTRSDPSILRRTVSTRLRSVACIAFSGAVASHETRSREFVELILAKRILDVLPVKSWSIRVTAIMICLPICAWLTSQRLRFLADSRMFLTCGDGSPHCQTCFVTGESHRAESLLAPVVDFDMRHVRAGVGVVGR
jgi:hypothetical protein